MEGGGAGLLARAGFLEPEEELEVELEEELGFGLGVASGFLGVASGFLGLASDFLTKSTGLSSATSFKKPARPPTRAYHANKWGVKEENKISEA